MFYTETKKLHSTINVHKYHSLPQRTLQLVYEDRVFFVWVDLHVSVCGQQHPNFGRGIPLVYPLFCCKLRSSSKPTNTNQKEL